MHYIKNIFLNLLKFLDHPHHSESGHVDFSHEGDFLFLPEILKIVDGLGAKTHSSSAYVKNIANKSDQEKLTTKLVALPEDITMCMKTHLFFDLDNTVTRSRSKIATELRRVLTGISHDIIIVSGAICAQIATQMDGVPCYKLGQNGNHAESPDGTLLWEELLLGNEKEEVYAHIHMIPRVWMVSDEDDLLQDRGCQISYSLLGHNEVLEKKEGFDPRSETRKVILARHPFVSDTLEVKIGGTTCLDYTAKGKHKGYYVARLVERMGWNKSDCVYFGDMLFPGGNDESVIGVIDTQPVENPNHTLQLLQQMNENKL